MQPTQGGAYELGQLRRAGRTRRAERHRTAAVRGRHPDLGGPQRDRPRHQRAKAPAHLPTTGVGGTAWSSFLKAAVARYKPGGAFWAEHPLLPQLGISDWQIWNEPNFKYFVAKPNPTEYGKLVTLSSKAIKSADPTAQVILAGLFAKPAGGRHLNSKGKVAAGTSPNWWGAYFLEQMYKTNPGIKTKFQGVVAASVRGALPAAAGGDRRIPQSDGRQR